MMNYNDLFELGVDRYIENAFSPKQPIVYTHIPKCAGTSSVESFKSIFDNVWHFEFDKIESTWDQFLARIQDKNIPCLDLAAGHFWPNEMNRLIDSEVPYHGITFLRHPIDRIISEYRYMVSETHPEHQQFKKEHPSFEHYVEHFVHDDAIAWMLFYGVDSIDEYYDKLKSMFRFIGICEFYHMSMCIIFESIGKPYSITLRLNTADTRPQYEFEISSKAIEYLHDTQSLDIEVFENIYLEYAGIVDSFLERHLNNGALQIESDVNNQVQVEAGS